MLAQLAGVGGEQVGGVGGREESLLAPLPLQLVEHLGVDAVGQGDDFPPHGGVEVVELPATGSERPPVRDPTAQCLRGSVLRPGWARACGRTVVLSACAQAA